MTSCPECGAAGRKVGRLTVESHVQADRIPPIEATDGWRFCRTPACEVGYFASPDETPIKLDDMETTPFPKSDEPGRLVCFCFEHTVAAVAEDARLHPESTIRAAISEACRGGRDDCERKNPEGRCCLGDVAAVVREAGGVSPTESSSGSGNRGSCCPSASPQPTVHEPRQQGRAGLAAAGGAMGAAVLSSACCWLPLLLIGLGVSTAGVGAFFEAWRVPLLVGAASLQGLGFYLVYVRTPACEPGGSCAKPNPLTGRRNKALLWLATLGVATFAFFPEYVTVFTGDSVAPPAQAAPAQTTVIYTVEGMTCGGCASRAKTALGRIEGVASARVSYEAGEATVVWSATPDHSQVAATLKEAGYGAATKVGQ